jgi:hypothetical protein
MPPRKKRRKASTRTTRASRYEENPHLPGYLLIAFGLLALPINFGLLPGLEWLKAWPLLLVLFGFAHLTKTFLSKGRF